MSTVEYGVIGAFVAVTVIAALLPLENVLAYELWLEAHEMSFGADDDSNLITNWDFSESTAGMTAESWGFSGPSIPGWLSLGGQDFELHSSGWGGLASTNGAFWLDMGAGTAMDIAQDIDRLLPGYVYTLRVVAGDRDAALDNHGEVYWNGVKVGDLLASQPDVMEEFVFLVEAAAGTNTLRITEVMVGADDAIGMGIDSVSLWGR